MTEKETLIKIEFGLAYLAGFFDGEGSVGIYSSGKTYRNCCLRVQIKQNESNNIRLIFKYLYENYGGFTSCTRTYKGKNCLTWACSGDKAVVFLRDIQRFSVLKQDQISLCIDWQTGRKSAKRSSSGTLLPKDQSEIDRDIEFSNKVRLLKDTALGCIYEPLKGDKSSRGCSKTK